MKGQHLRKSFFTRILVSYLCFVLISLISSVMIYRLASTRLIEKTTASDYATFRQFYSMLDQEFSNAADKVAELSRDYAGFLSLLEKASRGNAPRYLGYEITQRLRLVTSNSLGDLFVYLPAVEKVMSGCYATLSIDDYFYNLLSRRRGLRIPFPDRGAVHPAVHPLPPDPDFRPGDPGLKNLCLHPRHLSHHLRPEPQLPPGADFLFRTKHRRQHPGHGL